MTKLPTIVLGTSLAAAGLMGLSAPPACACSCAERTTSGYIDDAEMIARGTVVSIQSPRGGSSAAERGYQLQLNRVWKGGTVPELVRVGSAASGASCGIEEVGVGDEILLFADGSSGNWTASLCSGTAKLNSTKLAELTKELGQGTAPAPGAAPNAGGPQSQSRRWALPLAGVAVLVGLGLASTRWRRRR